MQATTTYDPARRYVRPHEWSTATQRRSCIFVGGHDHGDQCKRTTVLARHVETGEPHALDGATFATDREAREAMFAAGLLIEYRPSL